MTIYEPYSGSNHLKKEARIWTLVVRAALPEGDEDTFPVVTADVLHRYVCVSAYGSLW